MVYQRYVKWITSIKSVVGTFPSRQNVQSFLVDPLKGPNRKEGDMVYWRPESFFPVCPSLSGVERRESRKSWSGRQERRKWKVRGRRTRPSYLVLHLRTNSKTHSSRGTDQPVPVSWVGPREWVEVKVTGVEPGVSQEGFDQFTPETTGDCPCRTPVLHVIPHGTYRRASCPSFWIACYELTFLFVHTIILKTISSFREETGL